MKTFALLSLLSITGIVSAALADSVPPRADNDEVLARGLPLVGDLPIKDLPVAGQLLGSLGRRDEPTQEIEVEVEVEGGASLSGRGLPLVGDLPVKDLPVAGQLLSGLGRREELDPEVQVGVDLDGEGSLTSRGLPVVGDLPVAGQLLGSLGRRHDTEHQGKHKGWSEKPSV
ncbi:hypothetical protein BBP40_004775 [Aspergillus hancockii]|nr:hypothetical protein BBP40_004775 [Aspergillus hancockii]